MSHHCRSVDNQGDYEIVKAMGERVDEVVGEDVVLLKADVEGLEPGVIQSAKGLLESYKWVDYFLPAVLLHACMKREGCLKATSASATLYLLSCCMPAHNLKATSGSAASYLLARCIYA
jgi:hypothetical protein